MDTSDEYIHFDSQGVCNRCLEYPKLILPSWKNGKGHEKELSSIIRKIKKAGEGREYDCLLGLSGGLDSCYLLHLAVKEWGLRPYVLHIDAGWNLPVATENIDKMCCKLGVALHIEKMDWNEMREIQKAFFRTGHASLDAPQDHAFIALTDKYAQRLGVKYILNGYNISTEVVSDPISWANGAGFTGDGAYIKDVIKKHCEIPVHNYTFTSGFKHKVWTPYILGIKTLTPLNFVTFIKDDATRLLEHEYGYQAYGQKHFEDMLTKFLEGWWLPTRFGYDIRKAQLSSLITTGQMSRDEALEILQNPPLSEEESKKLFTKVAQKLEVSEDQLKEWHNLPKADIKYHGNKLIYSLGIKLFTLLGTEKRIRQ